MRLDEDDGNGLLVYLDVFPFQSCLKKIVSVKNMYTENGLISVIFSCTFVYCLIDVKICLFSP